LDGCGAGNGFTREAVVALEAGAAAVVLDGGGLDTSDAEGRLLSSSLQRLPVLVFTGWAGLAGAGTE